MFKFLLYHQGGRGWRPAPRRRAARLVVGESERWRADGWVAATRVVGGCDRPPPPEKAGVRHPRSYWGILDEARIRKHNTESIHYQYYEVKVKLLHMISMY
jgi:hypothetical protein